MMGNDNNSKLSAALVLGIVALVLSVYSTISVAQMKGSDSTGNWFGMEDSKDSGATDFDSEVKRVINEFVAEQTGQPAPAPAAAEPTGPVEVGEGSGIVKGDKDAPVTIVEFSDYQCPYCGRFFAETMPQIQKEYIDTGKVRYVFRDFPLGIHPNAIPAANAARCVLEEGNVEDYWAYHDILFQNQQALTEDALKTYATQIQGINAAKVADCIDEQTFAEDVRKDLQAGQDVGVDGTPAFFINGRLISGAMPFSAFQAVIDSELSAAKK